METTNIDRRYELHSGNSNLRFGILEANRICQLRCPGCYMARRNHLAGEQISLQQAVLILDLCREFTGRELETMDILGGEPLLWPHLQKFIEILLERGIKPWIFTNMLAITPKLASWLYERQIHVTGKLNIANPKDPEQIKLQAEMIGQNESVAQKMIDSIKIFRNAGYCDPLFRLQNLIRKKNLHLVPGYIRYCRRRNIGVDLELMASGEPVDEKYFEIAPTAKEIAELVRILEKQGEDCNLCSKNGTCQEKSWPEFNNTTERLLMPHMFGSCPFYDKGLYFAADGHIRACSNSTVKLAKLTDQNPISKAWNSPLLCYRRQLTQENVGEPCHSCDRWDRCRGGCRATVEGSNNSFGGYSLCPLPHLK